ncbi:MAG: YcaO-like family protein [Motilibacteraceae bacterium]
MIDYWRTLHADAGLTRAVVVRRPEPATARLWMVGAELGAPPDHGPGVAGPEAALSLVGACGLTRADTFVRAAGETVERFALLPAGGLPEAAPDDPLLQGSTLVPQGWSREGGGRLLLGASLQTGARAAVPADLVDYPTRRPPSPFDCSPSGAAAGADPAAALRAACRELLERDAAMIAWARQVRLPRVPLAQLAEQPTGQPLATLLGTADELDLQLGAGTAPTLLPGVGAVVCVAVDRTRRLVAAGLGLGASWPDSVVRAAREALQVWALLASMPASPPPLEPPGPVRDDAARAAHCRSLAAVEAAQAWVGSFVDDDAAAWRDPCPVEVEARMPPCVVVRLTGRLPEPVRAMGWQVVKVACPHLQPLRMDESLTWTVDRARACAPDTQWGLEALAAAEDVLGSPPHPFI